MTRHCDYAIRKRVEEAFGWTKTQAGYGKVKLRGRPKVEAVFTFAIFSHNLIRIPKLINDAVAT